MWTLTYHFPTSIIQSHLSPTAFGAIVVRLQEQRSFGSSVPSLPRSRSAAKYAAGGVATLVVVICGIVAIV